MVFHFPNLYKDTLKGLQQNGKNMYLSVLYWPQRSQMQVKTTRQHNVKGSEQNSKMFMCKFKGDEKGY